MSKKNSVPLLEPARTVIERVGGIGAAVEATGCDFSRVYRWMRPREKGGTNGLIPHQHQQRLLSYAKQKGRPLTPDDFFSAA